MTGERIKQIQLKTAYPNSISVQQALLQVWNECEQDWKENYKDAKEMISMYRDKADELRGLIKDYRELTLMVPHDFFCLASGATSSNSKESSVKCIFCGEKPSHPIHREAVEKVTDAKVGIPMPDVEDDPSLVGAKAINMAENFMEDVTPERLEFVLRFSKYTTLKDLNTQYLKTLLKTIQLIIDKDGNPTVDDIIKLNHL